MFYLDIDSEFKCSEGRKVLCQFIENLANRKVTVSWHSAITAMSSAVSVYEVYVWKPSI